MGADGAAFAVRTELTTIRLAVGLIQHGRDTPLMEAWRAREIAAAVDRLCATLEASAARLRRPAR